MIPSITQSKNNVKSSTNTKYYMQNNENNENNVKGRNENVRQEQSTYNGQKTSKVQEGENTRGESEDARTNELAKQKRQKALSNYQKQQQEKLGKDLPDEYVYSKSSQNLTIPQKMAKGRAVSGLKKIIENATNKRHEMSSKPKHKIDAKYGFYKYDTTFSFEHNGREQIYQGTILIRNDANGKKYLYDIIGIKKIGNNLPPVASNSQKSSARIGGSNFLPTNSITSNNKNVNKRNKERSQETI